jgi:hypothetical protein
MRGFLDKPVSMKAYLAGLVVVVIISAAMAGSAQEAVQGPQGESGKAGAPGEQGARGARGPKGERGPRGKAARNPSTPDSTNTSTTSGSSSIEDGTWEVGADISAGTYRARGGDTCYWEILKGPPSGDALDNIVENDVGSSNVIVTLSDGQWFNTDGCGAWSGR